jgi:hypothetical protein
MAANAIMVGVAAGTGSFATLSRFAGGITNSGAIATGSTAVFVGGNAVLGATASLSAFSGGTGNGGTISASGEAILVDRHACRVVNERLMIPPGKEAASSPSMNWAS